MYKEIKDALFLFAEKRAFTLTYLKKDLNLSDNQHQRLSAYLLHRKIIEPLEDEPMGREHKYVLSEPGTEMCKTIKTYQAVDDALRYFAQHPDSGILLDDLVQANVSGSQLAIEILANAKAIALWGRPVKEGAIWKITEYGKRLSENGGLTGQLIQSVESEFNITTVATPMDRKRKSTNTYHDMLLYLHEMDESNRGGWVDLLEYYSNENETYVRDVAYALEEKQWIEIKSPGPLAMAFYKHGEKPVSYSFPHRLTAKIKLDGIIEVEKMQKGQTATGQTIIHEQFNNVTHAANSPIISQMTTGNAINNSDIKSTIEQPKDKESAWKKWATGATIIVGLIVALYKALEAMHVI
jgi:hypothetical protein